MGIESSDDNTMSLQPGTIRYLASLFEDLPVQWIEELVSQYPTQSIEFLTEQCLARMTQIAAEKSKQSGNIDKFDKVNLKRQTSADMRSDYFNNFFNPNSPRDNVEKKEGKKQDDMDLPPSQLHFLYGSDHLEIDEV